MYAGRALPAAEARSDVAGLTMKTPATWCCSKTGFEELTRLVPIDQ